MALFLISSVLFGVSLWATWLTVLPEYTRLFDATRQSVMHYMPTVTASLLGLGLSGLWVMAGQGIVAIAVAAATWFSYRMATSTAALAVLLSGNQLLSSHAFIYDSPAAMAGLLLFALARPAARPPLRPLIGAVLVLAIVWPLLMFEQVIPVALNGLAGLAAFAVVAAAHLRPMSPPSSLLNATTPLTTRPA